MAMERPTRRWVLGGALAAVLGLLLAVTALACTALPSITLSQAYGLPGGSLELTGTTWRAGMGSVSVRWDSVSGPILAQAIVNADGTLAPATVTIPRTASAGYHKIEATLPGIRDVVARSVVQVVGGGATAPMPLAQLPTTTTPNSTPVGAGSVALLATLIAGVLMLLGAGTAFWIWSAHRVPIARAVRRR